MAVQTAAGAKSKALIEGLELKVKELERELARASSCAEGDRKTKKKRRKARKGRPNFIGMQGE